MFTVIVMCLGYCSGKSGRMRKKENSLTCLTLFPLRLKAPNLLSPLKAPVDDCGCVTFFSGCSPKQTVKFQDTGRVFLSEPWVDTFLCSSGSSTHLTHFCYASTPAIVVARGIIFFWLSICPILLNAIT